MSIHILTGNNKTTSSLLMPKIKGSGSSGPNSLIYKITHSSNSYSIPTESKADHPFHHLSHALPNQNEILSPRQVDVKSQATGFTEIYLHRKNLDTPKENILNHPAMNQNHKSERNRSVSNRSSNQEVREKTIKKYPSSDLGLKVQKAPDGSFKTVMSVSAFSTAGQLQTNNKQFSPGQLTDVSRNNIVTGVHHILKNQKQGFAAGLGMNINLGLGKIRNSESGISEKNKVLDYLPSLFAQCSLGNHYFIQTEFQFISRQRTPQRMMFDTKSDVTPEAYKEHKVSLHQLYYLNVPISIHYLLGPHWDAGAGVQYSYLKKIILIREECGWEKKFNNWKMTSNSRSLEMRSNPVKETQRKNRNPNSRRNASGSAGNPSPVDTVVSNFRSSELRWTLNVTYHFSRFQAGMLYNRGFNQFIDQKAGAAHLNVKGNNQTIQVFLKYQCFSAKKKLICHL